VFEDTDAFFTFRKSLNLMKYTARLIKRRIGHEKY